MRGKTSSPTDSKKANLKPNNDLDIEQTSNHKRGGRNTRSSQTRSKGAISNSSPSISMRLEDNYQLVRQPKLFLSRKLDSHHHT